jgi:hypothetical protein
MLWHIVFACAIVLLVSAIVGWIPKKPWISQAVVGVITGALSTNLLHIQVLRNLLLWLFVMTVLAILGICCGDALRKKIYKNIAS